MSLNLINVDQKKLVISIGLYSFFGLFFRYVFGSIFCLNFKKNENLKNKKFYLEENIKNI